MPQAPLADVFTADELARAAGVPRASVDALIASGDLRPVPGTRFFASPDAIRGARALRQAARASIAPLAPEPLFSARAGGNLFSGRQARLPAAASSVVHLAILVTVVLLTSGRTETAPAPVPVDDARMVFLVTPGPGGGGGGGGLRNPLPAPRVERRGQQRTRVTVPAARPERVLAARREREPAPPPPAPAPPRPAPVEREPDPLPSQVLVAPVASAAADEREREGVIEKPRGDAPSQGSGSGGGAGTGLGTGSGEGLGSGIGDGAGGGTGGGPYRPGSGIEPPRLLREVKAEYTDDARRRNLSGDVLLEIVVRSDGTVGDVTVVKGLGAGLDQRAVAAVRQWRFSPARRRGEPVDVIVEVAVEFTLR
jgi:protein TonB